MKSYINNTNQNVSKFDAIILKAMDNSGIFDDDFADIFTLTKTPDGSKYDYALDMFVE